MNGLFGKINRDKALLLMILPGIAWLILFSYAPMYGFMIGFQNYSPVKGVFGSEFVGLKYIVQFFNDPYFYRLMRNTLLLSIYSLLWGFPASIMLAISINEVGNRRFKRLVQSVSYFPYFISVVFLVGLLINFTDENGVVNMIVRLFNQGEPIAFFSEYKWFRTLYIASGIWQGVGFGSILFLGAISGISPELYEAARMDGAQRLQQIRHITLPLLKPTIIIVLILNLSGLFHTSTEKILLMYNPGIYEVADVIGTYMYRRGLVNLDFSYSTAVGFFQSAISLLLVIGANALSRRYSQTSLW